MFSLFLQSSLRILLNLDGLAGETEYKLLRDEQTALRYQHVQAGRLVCPWEFHTACISPPRAARAKAYKWDHLTKLPHLQNTPLDSCSHA